MVFALEPVERHLQMTLALTPQDGLVGLAVGLDMALASSVSLAARPTI